MLSFPNCKINIGLYITGKRPDGYHNLETVFYPVMLRDVLEITPAAETSLHLYGKTVDGSHESNLVWRAYQLLKALHPDKLSHIDIHLLKNIPMGAGMGGGSADGAFMLRLLNDFSKLGLDKETLIALALQLGSDCPFFIENTPQYASGRGELMQPVTLDLSAYSIQLVCPAVHISTADAFRMITPKPAAFNLKNISSLPLSQWRDNISNDFEQPVFVQHPELSGIKEQLYAAGAIYAAMSGSGSTIYGIFNKGEKANIQSMLQYESHFIA